MKARRPRQCPRRASPCPFTRSARSIPSQIVVGRDLLWEVLNQLTDPEWRLAELRSCGLSWPQVATATGGTAESRPRQLARALDRVVRQLWPEMDF